MTEEEQFSIGVIWPDAESHPVMRANQFATQLSPAPDGQRVEDLVLVVGNLTPPLVIAPPEEVRAMVAAVGSVTARTVGRFSMSRARLDELIGLLVQAAAKWDEIDASAGEAP